MMLVVSIADVDVLAGVRSEEGLETKPEHIPIQFVTSSARHSRSSKKHNYSISPSVPVQNPGSPGTFAERAKRQAVI